MGGAKTVLLKLVLISAGLAFFSNQFGPRRIPWIQDWAHHIEQLAKADGIPTISAFDVKTAFREKSALFVDARPADEFVTGHISGAISVPLVDDDARLDLLETARPLIIYCDGPTCDDALNLCRELRANGLENVRLFTDGFELWQRLEMPTEKGGD